MRAALGAARLRLARLHGPEARVRFPPHPSPEEPPMATLEIFFDYV